MTKFINLLKIFVRHLLDLPNAPSKLQRSHISQRQQLWLLLFAFRRSRPCRAITYRKPSLNRKVLKFLYIWLTFPRRSYPQKAICGRAWKTFTGSKLKLMWSFSKSGLNAHTGRIWGIAAGQDGLGWDRKVSPRGDGAGGGFRRILMLFWNT